MEYEQAVKSFIIGNFLFGDDFGIKDTTSFIENGIIDSTGVLELVAFLEDTFGIFVEDEELIPENLDSIDKVVEYLKIKRNKTGE